MAMEVAVTKKKVVEEGDDYAIKPTAVTPSVDTSSWPLLLKNYDKREFLLSVFLLMCQLRRARASWA